MRVSALKYTVLSWTSGFVMLILLLMPFHALLTVWGASLVGHYTELRLWKEFLLAASIIGALYLLLTDHKIRSHTLSRRLIWVILAYIALNVLWGLLALYQHDVTAKALGYGLIINLRFLAFFMVTWALTLRTNKLRRNWQWLVLWPAGAVIIFGLLQVFLLPNDFLRHLGYGPDTIKVFDTINSNINYVRVASTLRGANPLGAYLLIPISLTCALLLKPSRNWRQALLFIGALMLLFFTFSRSAWIGAALTIATILAISLKTRKAQYFALGGLVALLVIGAGLFVGFHNSARFENLVTHTQTNSAIKTTSNGGHTAALKSGLHDIAHDPMGNGVGTAGPASTYNDQQGRIAENYFIQIAQETGIVGLLLFVLINVGVGYLLWIRRGDTLALSLFASLIGLTLINMLSHAWADDTLAYVWWGLAGIAMAPFAIPKDEAEDEQAVEVN